MEDSPNARARPNSPGYDTQTIYSPRRSNTTGLFQFRAPLPPTKEEIRRHRNNLRVWIVCSLAFIILCPIISVMIGLRLHARDLFYRPDTDFAGRQVLIEVVLVTADPTLQTVTLDWTFLGEETSPCSATNLTGCTNINMFFDDNLLSNGADTIKNSNYPTTPIFVHNATAFAITDIIANTPTFRTNLMMFSPADRASSLLFYPFDSYTTQIFIYAQDATTNATIGIKIARTRGIATGFKTKAYTRPNRGNLVKAFSIVATVSIWLITLILLLVMLTCVFFGFRQKGEVLVVPVATLFAFTQLRGSMPGAPAGFGDVLDFVGLLPCLALLSLSAAITLGAFILSDPTEKATSLSWDLLFTAFPMLAPKGWKPEETSKTEI
ncbi:hypothetical protein BJ912DRAFT_1096404 [Pholiota molesta]|nr:hypothetical protein BJ912DRAFT_1096404 [Pholiota molesta]